MTDRELSLREEAVAWTETDDGSVIVLDLRTSKYLRLNPSGAMLWRRLIDGASSGQLVSELMQRYGLEPDAAQKDIEALLAGLRDLDLLSEAN